MTTTARAVALSCLERIDHEGAYANLLLAPTLERSGLDERDRRFATDLVYGTTRRRRACDALVDRFVMTEPEPRIRTLLRLGAYQLEFADVAPHAAVSATVDLAPRRARPFVNAILRRVAATPMVWSSDAERLSYPDWIVDRLVAELGHDDAMASLEAMDAPPSATERDDGYVQDLASQWVAAAVPVVPGGVVLDLCAAPGGKATALAAAGAVVVAADVRPHRARLIASNVARLGATTVSTVVADATAPPFTPGSVDAVLLDAPCSGLGTLRRRADARWRVTATDLEGLVGLQQQMIDHCAPLVRIGGTFVYSVCTLTAAESVDHSVPDFLEPLPEPPAVGSWRPFGVGWRLLPHDAGTDGMVLLRYRRSS
ncbi:MAG: transcription antitermination factor NusB [Ilumatobacteraceae bacterium]